VLENFKKRLSEAMCAAVQQLHQELVANNMAQGWPASCQSDRWRLC
jgi:hypothetical protein